MTDLELLEIARKIEAVAVKDAAKSHLHQTGSGSLQLTANRDAYLQVATASLLAAVWRPGFDPTIDSDFTSTGARNPEDLLDYVQIDQSKQDFTLRFFHRVDDVEGFAKEVRVATLRTAIGCYIALAAMLFLMISGIVYWAVMLW